MKVQSRMILFAVLLTIVSTSCNSGRVNKLLLHKKWRVYDVVVPPGSAYDNTQITQSIDLKRGYYQNVYYQFLDNNLFIATIDNKPDSGKYSLLSDGKIISVTASNGQRSSENLVTITKLDETHFDMKVKSGEYYFILKTKAE
ncbi:hypothetical protein [Chitinophaga rhizophila]|uniref:Lipocalin-like domain-containing protein n=1 Tax=Chitinophaga rhizophila TaxID=2866212 RepID=A0ABS7G7X9_9BACT|nr:hypothetical protein [Chitinophaga rhizophila]MBW8683240.1 hypothetical protein [Chitinophaga rhizophila]